LLVALLCTSQFFLPFLATDLENTIFYIPKAKFLKLKKIKKLFLASIEIEIETL
jgi:hypothetical protein